MDNETKLKPASEVLAEISPELRATFQELVERWDRETRVHSFAHMYIRHPVYQEILNMGEVAIPLMLEQVDQYPTHLFITLAQLTHHDAAAEAVKLEDGWAKLNVSEAITHWQNWGREKGYLTDPPPSSQSSDGV